MPGGALRPRILAASLAVSAAAMTHCRASAEGAVPPPVEARFGLPRESYVIGEPVVVEFLARNVSQETQRFVIDENDSYYHGFRIKGRRTDGAAVEHHGFTQGGGWLRPAEMEPGGILRRRIIVNRYFDITEPGTYELSCEFNIELLGPPEDRYRERPGGEIAIRQELRVEVLPFDEDRVRETAERLKAELEGYDLAADMKAARDRREAERIRREVGHAAREAVHILGYLHADVAAKYLTEVLDRAESTDPAALVYSYAKRKAVYGLARAWNEEAVERIERAAMSKDTDVRRAVATWLRWFDRYDARGLGLLRQFLKDEDNFNRADAVCALAEAGHKRFLPAICELRGDPDAWVRHVVASAIGHLGAGDEETLGMLYDMLDDHEGSVRWAAVTALAKIGDERSAARFEPMLDDPHMQVREAVVRALANAGHRRSLAEICQMKDDAEVFVRGTVAYAIGRLGAGDEEALAALHDMLGDREPSVRCDAVRAVGKIGDEDAAARLEPMLDDPNAKMRAAAAWALAEAGRKRSLAKIRGLEADPDRIVRGAVASAVGVLGAGDEEALAALHDMLGDREGNVRLAAIGAVARIGDQDSVARLEAMRDDPNVRLRESARRAVEALKKRLRGERTPAPTEEDGGPEG